MTATIETPEWVTETMTSREIAKAIGVGTRTRKYVMRDRDGYTVFESIGMDRYAKVLCSLMNSDLSDVTYHIRLVARALHKSISTGRMNPVCSNLIQERYTPYQLCALVAQISRECDETTMGGTCAATG